jgi:methyl-accepting chemotaxis protein
MRRDESRRLALVLVLALGGAVLCPTGAQAQAQPKVNPVLLGDTLTSQERDMLALAQDFARRCGDQLESWIGRKEVTVERLFSFLYYPMPKTDPPKFTTDWDRLSDRDVQAIEESVLAKSSNLVFAVLVDKQGYLPTHNQRYSMPLTGNLANDLVNNRTKRIFNDRTGLAAARSEAPFLIQKYQRDTGETMVDLSVPVFVRGVHWGAVRLGYRLVESH